MADLPLRNVKSLCTTAEFRLLESTIGTALTRQKPTELSRLRSMLRGMRDKWRTKTTDQRRSVRGERGGNAQLAAGRSDTKQLAFAQALARVERQLGKVGTSKSRRASPAVSTKTRAAEHRQTRATTRGALRESMVDVTANRAGKGAKRAKSGTPLASIAKSSSSAKVSSSGRGAKGRRGAMGAASAKASKNAAKPTKGNAPNATGPSIEVMTLGGIAANSKDFSVPPTARGRSAGAASGSLPGAMASAKARQIRQTGLTSRVLGHVSAQGRRKQARRDLVNRKGGKSGKSGQ